ncbi:lytic transglycosylase domain-containing protein [Frankia sp. Mgl5]|uniref:lytic transglycosylase domain-containing protein n=1 Tax=Frankia sp. Mgl5 TaxID=2933793 RepID=UPI00200DFE2E|nr:lytic transglycosylase domain-containing protein [Frankia sp. Mgl5]MCK9929848.1 lytic transglycosylase domain-containing protein [Frankia sp. Mgl5]
MTVLPTALAAALLLFCTAGTPRDDGGGGDRDQLGTTSPPPVHPGDWAMPELVPNGSTAAPDPATLTSQSLAEDATVDPADVHSTITLTAAARGVPARLLAAYNEAADRLAEDEPGCHLPWELLAAIGKVESGHANGRPIAADGTVTRPIIGPALNGADGTALIRDSDRGALDGDTAYDHAVGPMQFIPTTWRTAGRDGNGDGRKDPHNIYDATLAAGYYLCAHGRDLADPDQLRAAILAYNPSDAYVRTVLTYLNGYRQGGAAVLPPSAPAPAPGSGSGSGSPALDGVPIVEMTPNGQGGEPSSPPGTPPPTATPSPTPPPPAGCEPLRAADLTVTLTDLDPDVAGYESLDLAATRTPWTNVDVTVETEADTTAGTVITTSRRTVPAGSGSTAPVLLARIPGPSLAVAKLADDSIVLTLTVEPADGACPAVVRLRIRNVHPDSFAPPAAPPPTSAPPTTAPPTTTPPATPPGTAPPTTTPPATPPPTAPPGTAPPPATPSPTGTPPPGAPSTMSPTTTPPDTTPPGTAPSETVPPAAGESATASPGQPVG